MSKSAKRFFVFLLVFQLIIPYSAFAAAVGEFSAVSGDVTMTRSGKAYTPAVRTQLELKDLIVTGDNSGATMVFSDESTIKLSQNSKLEIREFLFKDNSRQGIFSLAMGKLTADVRRFIGGDNAFEVQTPTAIAGVRGTGFEVIVGMVGGQMATTVICTAGAVSISAISATGVVLATTTIVAGQTAVITATGITVSATAGTAAGAGAAVGAGAAAGAGEAAGGAAVAGVGVGTIVAGVFLAAIVAAAIIAANSSPSTTTHHTTTTHH
jgi:hypothetical protein